MTRQTTDYSPSLYARLSAMGFRPLFLLAGLWSALAIGLWLSFWSGSLDGDTFLTPFWWHGHEMLFGFVGAAAAGFMFTAAPIWSKSPPLTGPPLMRVVVAWILGRLAIWAAPALPALLVALVDLSFWVLFLMASAPSLWHTGNRIHRIFPTLLGLVLVGNLLMHLEAVGWSDHTAHRGLFLGIDAIIFFLIVVGGHIMPMFTRETLNDGGDNLQFPLSPPLEIAGSVTMLAVLIGNFLAYQHAVTGGLYILAAAVQTIRFSRWHIFKTFANPMLWSLHIGFSWLILGLFLSGLARLTDWLEISTALHALTVGAMGFFTLGIMSRISLIHTGRPVRAEGSLTLAFFTLLAAATIRLFPELPLPGGAILISGSLWIISYVLFLRVFWFKLLQPRLDGEPG
ncbi:MAG: NnrS family protein [Magnetococcales bacterium]|nr:NnrS family protein [Magnetococcales bacterium]